MEFVPEKKLGFGLMRLPRNNPDVASDVNLEELKKMVDTFMANGFTYFDTAWMYNGFASEHCAKAALVDRYPRESFTLATKLHAGFIINTGNATCRDVLELIKFVQQTVMDKKGVKLETEVKLIGEL